MRLYYAYAMCKYQTIDETETDLVKDK